MPVLPPIIQSVVSVPEPVMPATHAAGTVTGDLASALQALASETDRDRRLFAMRDLVNSIAIKDMPSALAQANTIKRPELPLNVLKVLFSRWGEAEPQTAVKYVQALPRSQEQKLGVQGVLDGWVRQDAATAAAWVQTLPAGDLRNQSWSPVISALARQDPASALALAESQNLRCTSEAAYISVFRDWAALDPATAGSQAINESAGRTLDTILSTIASQWAANDPVATHSRKNQGRLQYPILRGTGVGSFDISYALRM